MPSFQCLKNMPLKKKENKTKNPDFKNGFHNSALMFQATVPGWSKMQGNLDLKM